MFDVISIGHAVVDLYFKGDSLTHDKERFHLAIGGKYTADHFYEGVGGGGANVAIGLARNGIKTALFSIIGNNPFRNLILDKLREQSVDTSLCLVKDDYTSISSILLNEKGEKTVVHYHSAKQHVFSGESVMENLKNAKAVYFGNLPDVPVAERVKCLWFLKENAVFTYLNLGVEDCRRKQDDLKNLIADVDMVILNSHELAEALKTNFDAVKLSEMNYGGTVFAGKRVVVTDGEKGSWGYEDGNIYFQEAIPVSPIVDATGAGDGYTAGFIAEHVRSGDMKGAMKKGAEYASYLLGKVGAN